MAQYHKTKHINSRQHTYRETQGISPVFANVGFFETIEFFGWIIFGQSIAAQITARQSISRIFYAPKIKMRIKSQPNFIAKL